MAVGLLAVQAQTSALTASNHGAEHRAYKAKKTCKSAEKSGFVKIDGGTISLTEDGERLVEGCIWGLAREAISREWKFISLLLIILGWVIGRYAG